MTSGIDDTSDAGDVRQTAAYGHSHDLARKALPFTLMALLLGLFLMTPLDDGTVDRRHAWLGGFVVFASAAFLGVVIFRRTQPSAPSIVLSPSGVLFRDISETPIPWNEIREVGVTTVRALRDFSSTRVVKLVVSQHGCRSIGLPSQVDPVIAQSGNPSEIYLSYYHDVPLDALHTALLRRWHAFSRHAEGQTLPDMLQVETMPASEGPASPAPRPQLRSTVAPASSLESFRALGALIRTSSPGQLIVIAASVTGIVALVTNHMGFWSTTVQERGRVRAAEWRAWQEQHNADLKASEAEQRRIEEMWDKKFECMNEHWDRQQRGGTPSDPDCMK